jgi:hypothetical protein
MSNTNIINKDNIDSETYYNLCRIANFTKYSQPHKAIKVLGFSLKVERDECNNIVELKWNHSWRPLGKTS